MTIKIKDLSLENKIKIKFYELIVFYKDLDDKKKLPTEKQVKLTYKKLQVIEQYLIFKWLLKENDWNNNFNSAINNIGNSMNNLR